MVGVPFDATRQGHPSGHLVGHRTLGVNEGKVTTGLQLASLLPFPSIGRAQSNNCRQAFTFLSPAHLTSLGSPAQRGSSQGE